jgi:hypothetical protein
MTTRRILLTVGGLLFFSAGSLAAQEMKVTCKDGTLSKGGQAPARATAASQRRQR